MSSSVEVGKAQGAGTEKRERGRLSAVKRAVSFRESGVLFALFVICLSVTFLSRNFLSSYNLATLARSIAFISIVAIGQTLVLITGEIDLSVGAVAGFTGVISGWMMVNTSIPPWLCIVLGIAAGSICGLINGLLITKVRLNSFVVTLGTTGIFSGLTLIITKGFAIVRLPESIFVLGQGALLGVPLPIVFMIILAGFWSFVLHSSVFGTHVYAVGCNSEAARLVGIDVDRVKSMVFVVSGAMASFAGIVMVARLTSAQPTIGLGWQLPSIAAAVIGGTPLSGGEGGPLGTIIGAALMGVLENAIVLLGISPYWQTVVSGLVVVVSVAMDTVRKRALAS